MENWRKVLAVKEGEEKLMIGFKRYKTDNDVELPNAAEFKGDLEPSKTGNPGKLEVKVYEEANKQMEADKKREDKTKGTSALMGEDVKRKDMAKHISEEKDHTRPSYAGKKIAEGDDTLLRNLSFLMNEIGMESEDLFDGLPRADYSKIMSDYKKMGELLEKIHMRSIPATSPKEVSSVSETTPSTWASLKKGWRNVFGDVSFKNKPDGTVQIDITSHPNEPLAQNPITQQPGAMSPTDVQQKEQQTGTSAEASLSKESFVQPGQRVKHINSGLMGTVDKVEGKDVYVNTDNGSTAIWGLNEINAVSAAPQTNTPAQNISQYFAGAKKWDIKKIGNLSLIGAECEKCAGIQIEKDGKAVESYMVNKDGHEWRSLVNQAVWESKMEEYSK
jgi:hypothetical protein